MKRRFLTAIGLLLLLLPGCAARHTPSHPGFDDVAHWKPIFESEDRMKWQRPAYVLQMLGVHPGDVVADLGAGTGFMTYWLAAFVDETGTVYAVETEPKMLEHIALRADIPYGVTKLILAEPDDPKLPEGELDLVFICNTWHHIDDRAAYLDRLEATLDDHGRVAVVDWRKEELPLGPSPKHKLSREAVIAEFEQAGWSLNSESVALEYQYVLLFDPPSDG